MGATDWYDGTVEVDGAGVDAAAATLLRPLLHEIRTALERLLDGGEATQIDLGSLPLGVHNEAALKRILGDGEVSALVQAFGESEVEETGYAGVWWVEHRDPDGAVIGRAIEVAFLPSILLSPRDDIAAAMVRLGRAAAEIGGSGDG